MAAIRKSASTSKARVIVYAGIIAAAYAVLTIALAPISFGPLQLRVAGLLKPLSLLSPVMGLGLAVGGALAHLTSPFGPWDFIAMPLVSLAASLIAHALRRLPWWAMVVQAALVGARVAPV